MREVLIVGAGGFVGAILRYLVSGVVHRFAPGGFPLGTLVVNVLGCFGFGVLAAVLARCGDAAAGWRSFCGIGILGAFTTYSTFNHDVLVLMRAGRGREAVAYLGASLLLGAAAFLVAEFLVLRT